MKRIILIFIICLTVTQLKANVIANLKSTPVTKFDFLLKDYRNAINLQISRYMNEVDNFRVRLDKIKMNFAFDEETQLFIIDLYARVDQNRYSQKKIKIKKRDCNIIRNKIFVNKYGYGMLLSSKPTSYFTKNYITNNAIFLLKNTSLNNEEKKEIIKKSIINIELDHPSANQNITCKGTLNQVPLN
ncbi:MAG: hypothetical protein CBC96_02070 [Pelagibacteraceae bacterium TMED136]|nr:MAG: hypothetical protein CBC96_02070 [Pelagibacteraceae bacterium TMED136]|tara:strand:- start:3685 stop:4245 length:561 start_codon:yes stop_codon:yes gene_type:complete